MVGSLAVLAAVFAAQALRAQPPTAVSVLVAAHDLAAGARVEAGDLETVAWPPGTRPSGSWRVADGLIGATLASPVRQGEPFTDARILGPGLLTALPPGSVAVPVRIADGAAAGLVRSGDQVDLYAVADPSTSAALEPATERGGPVASYEGRLLGSGLRVLAAVPSDAARFGDQGQASGGLLLVAASNAVAGRLAGAATLPIALTLHPNQSSDG